jgi:hypothetical protein
MLAREPVDTGKHDERRDDREAGDRVLAVADRRDHDAAIAPGRDVRVRAVAALGLEDGDTGDDRHRERGHEGDEHRAGAIRIRSFAGRPRFQAGAA